jgi:hypothetical protein
MTRNYRLIPAIGVFNGEKSERGIQS